MGEFSGMGFAPGTVSGYRSWDVDTLGRLQSVFRQYVWRPGENTAECVLPHEGESMTGCSCGYWAYYDGDTNNYESKKRIQGVIEGYGETVIGTRGFRSTKAKIVALTLPKVTKNYLRRNFPFVSFFLKHEEVAFFVAMASGILAGLLLCASTFPLIYGWSEGDPEAVGWGWRLVAVAFFFVIFSVAGGKAESGKYSLEEPHLTRELLARVRHNYPDVKVYSSVKRMMLENPVKNYGAPEDITPETDPKFWERVAP